MRACVSERERERERKKERMAIESAGKEIRIRNVNRNGPKVV